MAHHSEIRGSRLFGTGLWILETTQFRDWVDPDLSSVFWLNAKGMTVADHQLGY